MRPLIPIEETKIFYNRIFSEPQLNHPECVALDSQGNIWCGGEKEEIFKIARDGSSMEQVTTKNGFILGLIFDQEDNLYICDMKHNTVFRYNLQREELIDFTKTTGRMNSPNYAIVDEKRHCLYVSESVKSESRLPGLWKFDLTSCEGCVWSDYIFNFTNGLALSQDGQSIYVTETFANKVTKVNIDDDGNPASVEDVIIIEGIPDGLVIDDVNQLYICCYEPSRVYRIHLDDPRDSLELVVDDPHATTLCHPTNGVLRDSELFLANLGRWHISIVNVTNL